MTNILNKQQIKSMKACGKILSESLFEVVNAIKPGINTLSLDQIAETEIRKRGGEPSFLNYKVRHVGRYPKSLCVSINNEIVHGIPSPERILKEGDIVSLDLGAKYQDVNTDMAVTVPVGKITKDAQDLIEITRQCLDEGIKAAMAGRKIGAIGRAVQEIAEKNGFSVVRDLVGHGIGELPHMDPAIPNYGRGYEGPTIEEGMALAIEPMITAGGYEIKSEQDGWTISTWDGSLAAHFEHTIIIENSIPLIVTRS